MNTKTPHIGAALAILAVALLPTANAFGTSGLPVAVSASTDTNGAGAGVGYGVCDPVPTTCAAAVAAAGEACADGSGSLAIFSGSIHVCVQYGGAATASYARLILTSAETGQSVVAWNEAGENCYWNWNFPFYHCDATTTPHQKVSNCAKTQTASLAATRSSQANTIDPGVTGTVISPDLGDVIGSQYFCTTFAGGSGSICFTAKAQASAKNDLFSSATPTAEADGCSADATGDAAGTASLLAMAASSDLASPTASGGLVPFTSLPRDLQDDLIQQVVSGVQRDLASSAVSLNPELLEQAQQALVDGIVGEMQAGGFDVAMIQVE